MLFSENNWYEWSYGGQPFERADGNSQLKTKYGKFEGAIPSFEEALLLNAKSTIDHYPNEQFDLLYSGGIDSELVLRTYKALGHPVRVNIFRYENDYNIYDVSHAVVTCEALNVPYKIIDFNLKSFYENDVMTVSEQAQSDRPRALVQLKFLDLVDGLPISASSDIRFYRPHDDYRVRAEWRLQDFEHDIAMDRYAQYHGRKAIMQWFKWTPQIVLGWTNMRWFNRLVYDRIPGKLGVTSTKIQGYQEVYSDMLPRTKQTGFEKIDHLVLPVEAELERKNGGLKYRQVADRSLNELWMEMCGDLFY